MARRLLRISFGIIWIFDGLLQAQASMPLGMAPQVIQPAAATSPSWVQHLDNVMATAWSYHPITVPAGAVWLQVGIGIWLLAAPRGRWSRLGGVASVVWGLIVWVFGEAFGGIFAPGLTWLFGAPGAVLFYCFAGVLVALPERLWTTPRLGRVVLGVMGAFFVGMAVLQAWPGRGFWQGRVGRSSSPGTLTSMVQQMAGTPQPRVLSAWVTAFASFDAAHGFAVNLFVVVALAAIGVGFLSGRPAFVRPAVGAGIVLCLADWVLIEDFGFLGGVGTDPNSMIPMALVFIAGYLALTRLPAPADEVIVPLVRETSGHPNWLERLKADPTYALRSAAAIGAIGVVLVGAAPMALATTNRNADPIIAQAIDGTPNAVNIPAPAFDLVNQGGRQVTLASLRGKTIALTFLDPVCTSDCPLIAQELRLADRLLGGDAGHVELVAIDANPADTARAFLDAFDNQEGLEHVPNWLYLTGTLSELTRVWGTYGVQVAYSPGGAMIAHTEVTYVIDARGHTRFVLDTDPGPASSATQSSFAVTLASAMKSAMGAS